MKLLLRGGWRVHSDKGHDFMGAVESWLREHATLNTSTGVYDPDGSLKRGTRCLLNQAKLWPTAAEHANAIYNHSNWSVPGQRDVVEPIILEQRNFVGEGESDLSPQEKPGSWEPWSSTALAVKLEHPTVRPGSLEGFSSDESGKCHMASKSQLSVTIDKLKRCSRVRFVTRFFPYSEALVSDQRKRQSPKSSAPWRGRGQKSQIGPVTMSHPRDVSESLSQLCS